MLIVNLYVETVILFFGRYRQKQKFPIKIAVQQIVGDNYCRTLLFGSFTVNG